MTIILSAISATSVSYIRTDVLNNRLDTEIRAGEDDERRQSQSLPEGKWRDPRRARNVERDHRPVRDDNHRLLRVRDADAIDRGGEACVRLIRRLISHHERPRLREE